MTPPPVTAPRQTGHTDTACFVAPVAPVRALHDPTSPSASPSPEQGQQGPEAACVRPGPGAPGGPSPAGLPGLQQQGRQGHAGDSNAGPAAPPDADVGRRHRGAVLDDAPDAAMGVGEGEGGATRRLPSSLRKTAFSTPSLLPSPRELQHQHASPRRHHQRHHSDTARAADDVMHQLQHEREKRLHQMDSSWGVKVVPDKTDKATRSAPAPQHGGRSITVTACSQTNPRPQRWSLGGPLTGTSWDIVLGRPPPPRPGHAHNGVAVVPTLSLSTQQQQPLHGPLRGGSSPRQAVDAGTDVCHGHPVLTDHLVRFGE
ncbi:hypothetical protein ONE63_005327 [Megalurothrips usitatus]|uniref:Uncharacterized protein n=1 Tax=Megalurothrips usitatus TaxID=439358 RepID=A0AAV7XVN8_9NEOP|nr:hypothetical protein ONE63_005327 [Megalurothrips usitatus]